jgi:hypothetical protein
LRCQTLLDAIQIWKNKDLSGVMKTKVKKWIDSAGACSRVTIASAPPLTPKALAKTIFNLQTQKYKKQ